MILKTKILLLTILPLLLTASLITSINMNQAHVLSELEIDTFREELLVSKKRELQNYVSLALTSIDHIIRNKSLDEKTARDKVERILNELTYGEDGYFFVYDRKGVNLVHPILPEIVGRNMYDTQDSNGNYVIKNLLRAAAEGGGFYRYLWNKPSANDEVEKLSYVVQVPRWKWMLGTGLYIDDIANEVSKIRDQVNLNIRSSFFTFVVVIIGSVIFIALIGVAINLHESRLADIRLRELAHHSVRFQVNERRRFARELHDGINQLMVSVKFRIESAMEKIPKDEASALNDLKNGATILHQAIHEVRCISHDLRPRLLDDMGLGVALESLIGFFCERTGITTDLKLDIQVERLLEDIEITLYRVVQEALTNIEHHANCRNVVLKLQQRGKMILLDIRDDGCGFDPDSAHAGKGIGLRNMRERVELLGGEFSLITKKGEGVRLKAQMINEL